MKKQGNLPKAKRAPAGGAKRSGVAVARAGTYRGGSGGTKVK